MRSLKYYTTTEGKKDLFNVRKDFVVYCLTNCKNNKRYIGITNKVRQRINQHVVSYNKGSKQYIHKALNHYGVDNFTFEILEIVDSREKLNLREVYYIKKYNTTDLKLGYNLTYGGKSKGSTPENTKNKITASKKVKVGQYDLQGNLLKIFNSVKEAERQLNIPDTDIHRCCNKQWSRKGFMFSKTLQTKIRPYCSKAGQNLISMEPVNKIATKLLNIKTNEVFEGKSIIEVCFKASIHPTTYHKTIKNNRSKKWKIIK